MLIYSAELSGSVTILAYRYLYAHTSFSLLFANFISFFPPKLAKEVVTLNDSKSVFLFKCKA